MAKTQTMFFATSSDISIVMSLLESNLPMQYTQTGLFEKKEQRTYLSYREIANFGHSSRSSAIANPCYLFSSQGIPVGVEQVPQKTGGILFAVDQLENPDTVALRPGGPYGKDVILYGTLGTVSRRAASRDLYASAAKVFRKSFVRQEEFLIGPEAEVLWRSGVRLTISAESPTDFDLKLPGQLR